MADSRLYNLDEQTSYSKEIFLVVDDDTFTAAKKMAVGTLYPKVDQLSTASSPNEDTWVLRVNNGSGAETKMTLANFLDLRYVMTELLSEASGIDETSWLVRLNDGSGNEKKYTISDFLDLRYVMTQLLNTASSPSTSDYLLRVNNGSGTEEKITIENFYKLKYNYRLLGYVYRSNGDRLAYVRVTRNGQIAVMTVHWTDAQGDQTQYKAYDGDGYVITLDDHYRPPETVYLYQYTPNQNENDYSCSIKIESDGTFYLSCDNTDPKMGSLVYPANVSY